MKIRIISLLFSLALILLSTYETSSILFSSDASTTKTAEFVFEKKQADKILDDYHLLTFLPSHIFDKEKTTYLFQHSLHNSQAPDILFRPPIFA